MPSVLLVQCDEYNGPNRLDCPVGIIPILSTHPPFHYKGVSCSRIQFPICLVYAIIVYKSQGLTLFKSRFEFSWKEHCIGLAYVAVSWVRT